MLLMVEWHSVAYYAVVLEAGTALLFLLLILLTAVKQRWSYSVFVVLAYIAPTLTGTFSSMPRYVLMMFPAFIFLGAGLARLGTLRKIYFLISGGLLGVTCALFTRGFFVS